MKRFVLILLTFLLVFGTAFSAYAAPVDPAEIGDGVTFTSGDWVYEPVGSYGYKLHQYIGEDSDVSIPYSFAKQYILGICDYAFYQNTNLTSIDLSPYLESIDEYAFNNCSGLKEVKFYPSIASIGMGCFYGCTSLSDVNLEDSTITSVPDYCFADCMLTHVTLPDTCTSIGDYAFYQCDAMTNIVIPASVTQISEHAFFDCTHLTIYCYRNSAAHVYAEDHEIPYVLIDGLSDEITFNTHSISLDGDIRINFYIGMPDAMVESGNAKVDFSWIVDGKTTSHSVTLAPEDKTSNGYKAACPVAIAELTYSVTATVLINNEVKSLPDTYSAVTYANTILTDEGFATRYIDRENSYGLNGEERLQQLRTLVKTLLDYGTKAQIRFNRRTDDLANRGKDFFTGEEAIPSNASDMEAHLEECGLEYYGSSVIYLSSTTLRHYYKVKDNTKLTPEILSSVTIDGEPVTYGTKSGLLYFDKTNIAAPKLDTEYVININGYDYQYSALDYSALSYSSDTSPYADSITKQLAASVYRYNDAANIYFNE